MIKVIIFDLDGVLIDSKSVHYESLNEAIEKVAGRDFVITPTEHMSRYDGLSTKRKLDLLAEQKGLSRSLIDDIWELKQHFTINKFSNFCVDMRMVETLTILSKHFTLVCCTNSIKATAIFQLKKKGLLEFFKRVYSTDDVKRHKPSAEMYMRAMLDSEVDPDETLIVEDSVVGYTAARKSGANVLLVESPLDVTAERIFNMASMRSNTKKWVNDKLNIVVPMAGAGSRFEKAGYVFPKPLIEVNGKPMIQVVVDNINIDAHYIFIVQKAHAEKYNLHQTLNLIAPGCDIIEINGITEGAACTVLLAEKLIDNDNHLLLANSDQFVEWNSGDFMYRSVASGVDGNILTFKSTHPKWSYAKIIDGFVTEVAEKQPISDNATVGIYYWKKGADFVKYAKQMIGKNIRTNNEFYVCPVYNQAIFDGKKVVVTQVDRMWGIGTPEDLTTFLNAHQGSN